MAAAVRPSEHLIDRLPPVRGRLTADAPIGAQTWFRVGGPAEALFKPADVDDLAAFLAAKPADVPVTVIGVGSNLLVRDGGIPGVTVKLAGPFGRVAAIGEEVSAGAGALDMTVAQTALRHGLGGLEFLSGVPGTVGGALRMNAGAYGGEIADVFVWAEALDATGRTHRLDRDDMGFSYRHTAVAGDWIFTRAVFKAAKTDPALIAERMDAIKDARADSQPTGARTGGSTFANPEGVRAWELIDRAGCRGLKRGGAQVSEKHCNFLINTGQATAADLEDLGEDVRRRVRETSGVELRWEIRRVGVRANEGGAA